jgi:2-polyprenyl-3-methyl-5-hydroxy-6-metoxy-1,4-benzoquinol methylase
MGDSRAHQRGGHRIPWVLPRQVFARRADRLAGTPSGASYDLAWAALDPPGSVLDAGAGAGAASLPLLARATALTAVDGDAAMLALLAERATAQGASVRCVHGSWPDAAPQVPAADVVTCHHVLYNVPRWPTRSSRPVSTPGARSTPDRRDATS